MKKWLESAEQAVPAALQAAVGGHPLVAQALMRRGIQRVEQAERFLNPAAYTPAPPDAFAEMERTVGRLRQALQQGETILVWGDFDVDGQTSTALLVSALRDLGAQVAYHIPDRFAEGHGVHLPTLQARLTADVRVLLTCDTGISAHEAVDYAQHNGVDVIITDHHSLPDVLPSAFATINPMVLPAGHPLRELPGVGTAYKLIESLYAGRSTEHLLDLVAIGIVADVMVQVDDTRYLLQRGLEVLRNQPRPGLRELMRSAGVEPTMLTETDIGFALAPRLNALGRLANANPILDLLIGEDAGLIAERVNQLEGLNQQRRFLTQQVLAAAQQQIAADAALLKYAVLVVSGAGWHTGVVGIVAGRLAEQYNRPAIVLSEQNGRASGSARSVNGVDIIEAIQSQAHLLHRYGGHNMAAGLSLATDDIFALRRGMSQVVRQMSGRDAHDPELRIDAFVELAELDLALAEDVARLAPFGNGNPPLTLATRNVEVVSKRALGRRGDHVQLKIRDAHQVERRVIWWFADFDGIPDGRFDLAYTIRKDVTGAEPSVLIEWLDARPIAEGARSTGSARAYTLLDFRQDADQTRQLAAMRAQYPEATVWREGVSAVEGVGRYDLQGADSLIVWSAPPTPTIWRAALNIVQPARLILFGVSNLLDEPAQLLKHLAGLVKYALNQRGGRASIPQLAMACGQSEQVIRVALGVVAHKAGLRLEHLGDDLLQVHADAGGVALQPDAQLLARLTSETRAYRRYWQRHTFTNDLIE